MPARRQPSTLPPPAASARGGTWSTVRANPAARHYDSVARRRTSARERARLVEEGAVAAAAGRVRPLEDEVLVGREAAEQAWWERLQPGQGGREVLVRENRRWDWMLGEWLIFSLGTSFLFTILNIVIVRFTLRFGGLAGGEKAWGEGGREEERNRKRGIGRDAYCAAPCVR
jgi:hypothetical protein